MNRIVHRERKFGVITPEGQELLPFIYDMIYADDVCKFFEVHKGGKIGIYAYDGTELLPVSFKEEDFSTNWEAKMFEVKRGAKVAFYNFNGKLILDAKYSSDVITAYCDGFVIKSGNNCRFMNLKGDIVLSGYDEIKEVPDYNQNVLKVKKDDKYGVFDLAGNEIMPVRYSYVVIKHGIYKGIDTLSL